MRGAEAPRALGGPDRGRASDGWSEKDRNGGAQEESEQIVQESGFGSLTLRLLLATMLIVDTDKCRGGFHGSAAKG